MKKELNIFDFIDENKEIPQPQLKPIELIHCMQVGSNNFIKCDDDPNCFEHIIYLGKHGESLDKLLGVRENSTTVFYLGKWNDGVKN